VRANPGETPKWHAKIQASAQHAKKNQPRLPLWRVQRRKSTTCFFEFHWNSNYEFENDVSPRRALLVDSDELHGRKSRHTAHVSANSSCVCLARACAFHTGSTCLKFHAHKSGTKTWARTFAARKVPHRTHKIQLLCGRCATVVRGPTQDTPPFPHCQTLCPTTRTGPANNLSGKLDVKSSTHMCANKYLLCVWHTKSSRRPTGRAGNFPCATQ
jgi:hypothetical protein